MNMSKKEVSLTLIKDDVCYIDGKGLTLRFNGTLGVKDVDYGPLTLVVTTDNNMIQFNDKMRLMTGTRHIATIEYMDDDTWDIRSNLADINIDLLRFLLDATSIRSRCPPQVTYRCSHNLDIQSGNPIMLSSINNGKPHTFTVTRRARKGVLIYEFNTTDELITVEHDTKKNHFTILPGDWACNFPTVQSHPIAIQMYYLLMPIIDQYDATARWSVGAVDENGVKPKT